MKHILLVEDDQEVAKVIQFYLSQNSSYQVTWVTNARDALLACRQPLDIILLDIQLPDSDGMDLCIKIRETIYCPIIFISGISDEDTIIEALKIGGDDYLTKPFNSAILQARIEANLRRVELERKSTKRSQIQFKDFLIDIDEHSIVRDGSIYRLAPIEFNIFMLLVDNPFTTFTKDEIYQKIWELPSYGDARTVMVHIYNLRQKIESNPNAPKYIKSMRGKGYYFSPDKLEDLD